MKRPVGSLVAFCFTIIVMFILGFSLIKRPHTIAEITKLAQENCPDEEEMNWRFKALYEKYKPGEPVPYIFTYGGRLVWEEIHANLDGLLED